MTEKQIRDILHDALAELDRRARKVILPSMLGVGLALSGCGDRAVTWSDGQAAAAEAGTQPDSGVALPDAELPDMGFPVPPYMAPEPDAQITPPPQTDYAAPMYAAPMPEPDGGE